MALVEFRKKLPNGDIGRIINSFIFPGNKDAVEYQRKIRKEMYVQGRKLDILKDLFYYDNELIERGTMYTIRCSMCHEVAELLMHYEYNDNKYFSNSCCWSEHSDLPVACLIPVKKLAECSEIERNDLSIILPCCKECNDRFEALRR